MKKLPDGAWVPPGFLLLIAKSIVLLLLLSLHRRSQVKLRIDGVEVFAVEIILHGTQGFTESLEMGDFPLSQIPDGVYDIRIVNHSQDVVVGCAGFLLCCNFTKTTFP